MGRFAVGGETRRSPINSMERASTITGLKVTARMLEKIYATGRTYAADFKNNHENRLRRTHQQMELHRHPPSLMNSESCFGPDPEFQSRTSIDATLRLRLTLQTYMNYQIRDVSIDLAKLLPIPWASPTTLAAMGTEPSAACPVVGPGKASVTIGNQAVPVSDTGNLVVPMVVPASSKLRVSQRESC